MIAVPYLQKSDEQKGDQTQKIYADYAATTPLFPSVAKALQHAIMRMQLLAGNPSSTHDFGRKARFCVEEARESIATYFGKKTEHILFTSGATESNNMILKGYDGPIFVGATEHDSVRAVRPDAVILSVDQNGILDLNDLEDCLKKANDPPLVAVMAANNETGIIHPLPAIFDLCERYGARTHVDSVQAVGKLPVDFYNRATTFTLSAHKIGGLAGVGALVFNPNFIPCPLFKGGGQERSLRPGTENFLGILSLMHAVNALSSYDWEAVRVLRDTFEDMILSILPKHHHGHGIIGKNVPRLPNISAVTMPFVKSAVQHMFFDQHGIAVSFGAACSSGKVTESHVLKAMSIPENYRACSLRFSFGPALTRADLEEIVSIWIKFYTQNNARGSGSPVPLSSPEKYIKEKG